MFLIKIIKSFALIVGGFLVIISILAPGLAFLLLPFGLPLVVFSIVIDRYFKNKEINEMPILNNANTPVYNKKLNFIPTIATLIAGVVGCCIIFIISALPNLDTTGNPEMSLLLPGLILCILATVYVIYRVNKK